MNVQVVASEVQLLPIDEYSWGAATIELLLGYFLDVLSWMVFSDVIIPLELEGYSSHFVCLSVCLSASG